SELSSLPRLRIPGTFANGWIFRWAAIIDRTCKCRVIRTERGILLSTDDQAHLTSHRAPCRAMPARLNGERSRAFFFPHLLNLLESCSLCRPDHAGLNWFRHWLRF